MNRPSGIEVTPRSNENPDALVKRFMRLWRDSGIRDEIERHRGFTPNTQAKRQKRARAGAQRRRDRK